MSILSHIAAVFRPATPDPDPRPDPEDDLAYTHAALIESLQTNRRFPLQTLRGGGKPSDVRDTKNWADPPAGFTEWVDVYEGLQGIGYVVNYEVTRGSRPFRKAINYGPEKYRERDWTEVLPTQIPTPDRQR